MRLHKKLRISITIYLTLIATILYSFTLNKNTLILASDTNLILDSLSYNSILPNHFRKTSDSISINSNKKLNLNGLSSLNISGSQQFSELNFPILIKSIKTSLPITIIDLRQEPHGFINGFSVSWTNSKNNSTVGLTREQVLLDETNKLKSIKLNVPLTFYNHSQKTIVPTSIQSESDFVRAKALSYIRIPVRDHGIPSDDMVNYFIEIAKTQPQNSWLHFHCKHGIGRTCIFMIMYDMVKNNKIASADNIIERQLILGNYNEKMIKSFYNNGRITFLKKFYDYCKINGNSFNIKWSEWEKSDNSQINISE